MRVTLNNKNIAMISNAICSTSVQMSHKSEAVSIQLSTEMDWNQPITFHLAIDNYPVNTIR